MSIQPSHPALSAAVTSSPAAHPEPFRVLLSDGVTIDIRKTEVTAFKYLLHLVMIKPEVEPPPAGLSGWMPMGHRAIGAIALRMDYSGKRILGHSVQSLNHKQWMVLCSRLSVFDRALDQLDLRAPLRGLAEWSSEPHSYFQRNIWLRAHWQGLRIREENPGLATMTISLSEAIAVAEAKDRADTAVRVATTATRARSKAGLN